MQEFVSRFAAVLLRDGCVEHPGPSCSYSGLLLLKFYGIGCPLQARYMLREWKTQNLWDVLGVLASRPEGGRKPRAAAWFGQAWEAAPSFRDCHHDFVDRPRKGMYKNHWSHGSLQQTRGLAYRSARMPTIHLVDEYGLSLQTSPKGRKRLWEARLHQAPFPDPF